jgi:hypothetical protein
VTGTDGSKVGKCIGHDENAFANCPVGRDFTYSYEVAAAGTITSLWASTDANQAGLTTVNVLKNGSVVMTCTPTAFACETTGNVSVVAGDFIQVQIDETGNPPDGGWKAYVLIGL